MSDGEAKFWIEPVVELHANLRPVSIEAVTDPVAALLQRAVELRVLQSLWALRDAVIESTLEFSIIRWRNALPRQAA